MSQKKPDAYKETEAIATPENPDGPDTPETLGDPAAAVASDTANAAPDAAMMAKMAQELEHARAAAAENMDKFIRAKAESENIQRRAQIDIANAHKYAVEKFANELLSVRDSLELAKTVDIKEDNTEMLSKMQEGLELTLKQMDDVFAKFQLQIIDPLGEKFDPERHQAISVADSAEVAPNHVLNVVQKGYLLNDRLLRPAMVVIAKSAGS